FDNDVRKRSVVAAVPQHDVALTARVGERESVVGDIDVVSSRGLDVPAVNLVIKNIVHDGDVGSRGVNRVLLVDVRSPADIVPDVSVEGEIVFAVVDVDPGRAERAGGVVPVADVFNFVPADGDVVRGGVGVESVHAGVFNHKSLDHYEG